MNPWQMAQQIKYELQNVVWPTGTGDEVFGARSVFVYAGAPPTEDEHPVGFPFALVTIDSGSPDEDDPDLILQTFSIATAVEVAGDPLGEAAVIGGARSDFGKSGGAGIAEVAERVRFAAQKLTAFDGAAVVVSGSGIGASNVLGRGRHIAFDEFSISALCTSQPRFLAPQELKVAGDTWSWRSGGISSRYDFLHYRLGYVAGDTPVASPVDLAGTIYTGTDTETAVAPVSGRTYQIFADYNGHGDTSIANSSSADLGSFLVI